MQERKSCQSLLHGELEIQDIHSPNEVLYTFLYQATYTRRVRDWTPEHFQLHHSKCFKAISNKIKVLEVFSNFYLNPISIDLNNSYKDEENKPGTLPKYLAHSLKLLHFWLTHNFKEIETHCPLSNTTF